MDSEESSKIEEIKDDDLEEKEKKKEIDKKQNNQLKWVIVFILAIILVIVLAIWVSEESKKFDYAGMHFKKELFGSSIPIYSTQIEGYSTNGLPISFKIVLRNDPRSLKIPVNASIGFKSDKVIYVSINQSSGYDNCVNNTISMVSLGQFFANLGLKANPGTNPKNEAVRLNRTFVDCGSHVNNTVLLVTDGKENRIDQSSLNPNCYILTYKDCATMQIIERFEIATLAQSMGKLI